MFAVVGIIWTAKGDMRPNGNDFSDSKTVLLRHQRDAKVQRAVSTKRAAKPAGKPASHTVKAGPLILGNENRKKWLDEHNKIRAGTNTWMDLKQGVASGMMRMVGNALINRVLCYYVMTTLFANALGVVGFALPHLRRFLQHSSKSVQGLFYRSVMHKMCSDERKCAVMNENVQ